MPAACQSFANPSKTLIFLRKSSQNLENSRNSSQDLANSLPGLAGRLRISRMVGFYQNPRHPRAPEIPVPGAPKIWKNVLRRMHDFGVADCRGFLISFRFQFSSTECIFWIPGTSTWLNGHRLGVHSTASSRADLPVTLKESVENQWKSKKIVQNPIKLL